MKLGDIRVLQPLNIFENARHRVVVAGWDGVELVVVTTCAGDRLRQQTLFL